MSTTEAPNLQEFIIDRTLDAPRELVWKALTEPGRMQQWFAPKGFSSQVLKHEFHPGGTYHYCMSSDDGKNQMWGKVVYREIAAPERLVYLNSFSDEKGEATRHPLSATWPLEMLTTFILVDYKDQTTLIIKWTPYNATAEEQQTFAGAHDGMRQGWTGTLNNLTEYLAKEQAPTK
jgi:uncharacterized protein YndB with AHSA1/START domain